MRDHLAHRYFDTAHVILQATVDEDLPALELAVTGLETALSAGTVLNVGGGQPALMVVRRTSHHTTAAAMMPRLR